MNQPLVIDDDDRYSRLRLISWWEQEKLRQAQVLVVGAGALGNEVLKNLALLGVGRIVVIDLDAIEDSNLTRSVLFRARDRGQPKALAAAAAARDINPDVQVRAIRGNVMTDLGLGLFAAMDVVIGCLDNREARLWVNRCCWKVGKPWIDGGIQEISGVVKVFQPPDSACYECAMTENDYRLINLRYSCPLLRREDLLAGKVPTAPTIASMIAGLQVQEALKLLHGMPVKSGGALVFNGVANSFYYTNYQRRDDCLSHEHYDKVVELPLGNNATAAELFAEVQSHFPHDASLALELDRDLVVSLDCAGCGAVREVLRPQQSVAMQEASCACGETARPVLRHVVESHDALAKLTLAQLGVPPFDVVRVRGEGEEKFFLLSADREQALAFA